jgi:hypothetical protein
MSLTLPEKIILRQMRDRQIAQETAKALFINAASSKLQALPERMSIYGGKSEAKTDFILSTAVFSMFVSQYMRILPTLSLALSKTYMGLKVDFLMRKSWEYASRKCPMPSSDDDGFFYYLGITIGNTFGNFTISKHSIGLTLLKNVEMDYDFSYIADPRLTLDEALYGLQQIPKDSSLPVELIDRYFKALAYVVCSGKPDLRESQPHKEINSYKKLRKIKDDSYKHNILDYMNVGLSFEKTPLYTQDEWQRRAHTRMQPYGPRGNPTHYELIWIDGTTVSRKMTVDGFH